MTTLLQQISNENEELSLQEQAFKLAYSFAGKYQKYIQFFDSFEDYVMSLTCHLLEKLSKYDNNVASFGTYAYAVFTNYVRREIMIQNYKKRDAQIISLDVMIDSNDDDSKGKVPLSDLIAVEDDTFEKIVNDEAYSYLFNRLSKYLSKEFIEHYAYKKTFAEIAREKHISKQCVNDRVLKDLEFIHYYIHTGKFLINNNRLKKLAKELDALLPEIKEHHLI